MDLARLAVPFPPTDIDWRLQQAGAKDGKVWGRCIAYITNRAIEDRLDEVCGPGGWQNDFRPWELGTVGVLCGIGIKIGEEWVWKWDGAEQPREKAEGQAVAVKGGFSAAMKRAGAQWGIGRYLYDLKEGFITVVGKDTPEARYGKLKDGTVFYWLPPKLPNWALPEGEVQALTLTPRAASAATATASPPEPTPLPNNGTAPTEKQVAFYTKLCQSSAFTPLEREQAMAWLSHQATRQTITGRIDLLKAEIEDRKVQPQAGSPTVPRLEDPRAYPDLAEMPPALVREDPEDGFR